MKKRILIGIVLLIFIGIVFQSWRFWYISTPPPFGMNAPLNLIEVERLQDNPIIHPTMDASLLEEVGKPHNTIPGHRLEGTGKVAAAPSCHQIPYAL